MKSAFDLVHEDPTAEAQARRDEQLERYIHAAWKQILTSASEPAKREAAARMAELIRSRSAQQIYRMEKERGLLSR